MNHHALGYQYDTETQVSLGGLKIPAVTLRCDGCITPHSAAARHGATKDEVIEALGVAITVNAGATLVYSARTMDAFAAKQAL